MISQTNAYEFLRTAFEHEEIGRRIAKFTRGDVDGLLSFAARLGFSFSPYDLTIALEWHIRELLDANTVAPDDLTDLLGVEDWESVLQSWKQRFQPAH